MLRGAGSVRREVYDLNGNGGCRARWRVVAIIAGGLLGSGMAAALPGGLPIGIPLRIIFVTSQTSDGNIGGLAGADALVAAAAANPGSTVSGEAVTAILSVTGTLAPSRFVDGGEPIYNTRGQLVAANLAAMFAGAPTSLTNAILYDETGTETTQPVWTGTNADGSLAPTHCSDYTTNSNLQDGLVGLRDSVTLMWTEAGTRNCVNPSGLYGLTSVVTQDSVIAVPSVSRVGLASLALLLLGAGCVVLRREF